MAKNLLPIPRFPLPDEWEPEGIRCVIVSIPDDPQYLATLTGLLDLLKWSDNFARDDTKTGAAIVCRTWQTALETQPITWGDCEQMILRQNPDDPCQLQQSQDGGDTWTLAFDYSLCSQVITVPAPYPGSETGASDAAAASMRNIFEGLTNLVDCGASRESYIDAATNYLRQYDAGYANPIALGAIYDEFCALDPTEQANYQSDCPYFEHKEDLEACANVEGLYDWLNCAAETINNWLNDTSNALMNALNSAAAALTGNGWQLSAGGGAGGGAGFGDTCEWTHVFDFTIDDGGFTPGAVLGASYSAGNGWGTVDQAVGAYWYRIAVIKRVLPSTLTLTYEKYEFNPTHGPFATTNRDIMYWDNDEVAQQNTGADGAQYLEYTSGGENTDEISNQMAISQASTEAGLGGGGYITKITLKGIGAVDPFL